MSSNFVLTSVSIREGGALQFWGNFENLTLQTLQFSLENENAQSVTHIKPVTIYLASSQKGNDLNQSFRKIVLNSHLRVLFSKQLGRSL